jgi:hypothetical protein
MIVDAGRLPINDFKSRRLSVSVSQKQSGDLVAIWWRLRFWPKRLDKGCPFFLSMFVFLFNSPGSAPITRAGYWKARSLRGYFATRLLGHICFVNFGIQVICLVHEQLILV